MAYDIGSTRPSEVPALGKVIDSMTRRLDTVAPDDPAARLLREELDELTEVRNRMAEHDDADRYTTNVAAMAAGSVFILAGAVSAGVGVYDRNAVPLIAGLLLALISGLLSAMRWPQIREHRAKRAIRQG